MFECHYLYRRHQALTQEEEYNLRLSEFSEAGCKAVITNVTVSLYGYVQDMDGLIQDALKDNTVTCQKSRVHGPRGSWILYYKLIDLFLTLLSSSP